MLGVASTSWGDPGPGMTDLLTMKQAIQTSWSTARHHAARAAVWSAQHPFVSLSLLYGALTYLGFAVLIGIPGRAIMALVIVGPAAWWCCGRFGQWIVPPTSRLDFFTGDNGPLRLSEEICSSKTSIASGSGMKDEDGGSVRVNIDSVEGYAPPTSEASRRSSVSRQQRQLATRRVRIFLRHARVDGAAQTTECGHLLPRQSDKAQLQHSGIGGRRDHGAIGAQRRSARGYQANSDLNESRADAAWSLDARLLPDADETSVRALEQRPVAARPPQVREA
jgi:hypothetical protein